MRSRRISFAAGWLAVAVLAVAGFAAFGAPRANPEEVKAEAAAASIGHTAGAYAGLAFARLGGAAETAVIVTGSGETQESSADEVSTAAKEESASGASGTIASPTSGWLSEVEVRALVSLYFEPADVNRAVRVAWCESRFDPKAVDLRTGGVGLFGHLPQYWEERSANAGFPGIDATDPEASTAAAAWEVYDGGGWDVFSCN